MHLYVVALLLVGAAAAGALVGVLSSGSDEPAAPPPTVPAAVTPSVPQEQDGGRGGGRATRRRTAPAGAWIRVAALRRRVAAIGRGGEVGVFVRPLGPGSPVGAGSLQTGPAWSTAKVPVVVARLRFGGDGADPSVDALAARAIRSSDNAAAQELFDQLSARLGGTVPASRYVTAVLRDAGDRSTSINSRRVRPEFSTFGQTTWALDEGTRFFSALARGCVAPRAADRRVAELMAQVTSAQRWGLARAGRPSSRATTIKGGWGPDRDGRYLVRQFGVVREGGRGVAVGLMATASDGGFPAGIALVDELARAVVGTVAWSRLRPARGCERA